MARPNVAINWGNEKHVGIQPPRSLLLQSLMRKKGCETKTKFQVHTVCHKPAMGHLLILY